MLDPVRSNLVPEILVTKNRVGRRGIAVYDLEADAMPRLEPVGTGHDFDVESVDLAWINRLGAAMRVERTMRGAQLLILLPVRCPKPSLCHRH